MFLNWIAAGAASLRRFFSPPTQFALSGGRLIEPLEPRKLLAANNPLPQVIGVVADNRAEVTIRFDEPLDPATINKFSFRIYGSGADGTLNTADDLLYTRSVKYLASGNRVVVRAANFPANAVYRVKVSAWRMKSATGEVLDGEYTGGLPNSTNRTGNGSPGGDFEFRVIRRATNRTWRMSTTLGTIDSVVSDDPALSTTVANFARYANAGRYDNTIIHRNGRTDLQTGPLNIIQGGGYTSTDDSSHIPVYSPIPLQSGVISNTLGTIAMARGNSPNSATSEWFFNTQTNVFLDATTPGVNGYAAFGLIADAASLNVITSIFNSPSGPRGDFNSVPTSGGSVITVRRVALLTRISPT